MRLRIDLIGRDKFGEQRFDRTCVTAFLKRCIARFLQILRQTPRLTEEIGDAQAEPRLCLYIRQRHPALRNPRIGHKRQRLLQHFGVEAETHTILARNRVRTTFEATRGALVPRTLMTHVPTETVKAGSGLE